MFKSTKSHISVCLSLVGFYGAFNTIKGYISVKPRVCTDRCPVENHKIKSALLFRLLNRLLEIGLSEWETHKKVEKEESE